MRIDRSGRLNSSGLIPSSDSTYIVNGTTCDGRRCCLTPPAVGTSWANQEQRIWCCSTAKPRDVSPPTAPVVLPDTITLARAVTRPWSLRSPNLVSAICHTLWVAIEVVFCDRLKTVCPAPAHSDPPHTKASLIIPDASSTSSNSRIGNMVVRLGLSENPHGAATSSSSWKWMFLDASM